MEQELRTLPRVRQDDEEGGGCPNDRHRIHARYVIERAGHHLQETEK